MYRTVCYKSVTLKTLVNSPRWPTHEKTRNKNVTTDTAQHGTHGQEPRDTNSHQGDLLDSCQDASNKNTSAEAASRTHHQPTGVRELAKRTGNLPRAG